MNEDERKALIFPIVGGVIIPLLGGCLCMSMNWPPSAIFLIAALPFIALGLFKMIQWIYKEKAKEQAALEAERLYATGEWKPDLKELQKEFAHYNIHEIESSANFQRAQLILSTYMGKCGLPEKYHSIYNTKDCINMYLTEIESKTQREREEKIAEENRIQLNKLREDEAVYKKRNTEYAELIGREKSIRYCQDQIDGWKRRIQQYERQAQAVRDVGNKLYETQKERESDWALHGGIASGIAGGAAGLAVASDVQRKNAQIRERNDGLATSIAFAVNAKNTDIYSDIVHAENSVKYWEKRLDKAKMVLIEFIDEKALLKKLSPKVLQIENSQTGAVKIKIELQGTPDFTIYENVNAVVDGSILVTLKAGGKNVGTAMCTLDLAGSYRKQTVICICTDITKQEEDYQISFEPYHLWAVEKH